MIESEKTSEEKTGTLLKIGTGLMLLLPVMFLLPAASAQGMEMDLWDSGDLAQNETWSHTFMMQTNDMFSCSPHPPDMGFPDFTGWVNVTNDSDASPDNVTIYIDGFAYSPRTVNIQAGVTVTFVNNDSAVHTATQMDMSGGMDMDDDMHMDDDHDDEDDGLPGFALGLTLASLAAASVVISRKRS